MNIKRLLGETIIYGIGAILPRVITFLLNPLYINYIDKEAFAIFTSLYAWIAFINIVLTFGFETSYFRFSGEDKTGAAEKNVFSTAFWFIAMLAGGFLVMVLLFSNPLSMLWIMAIILNFCAGLLGLRFLMRFVPSRLLGYVITTSL